jgi:hypothetical protein
MDAITFGYLREVPDAEWVGEVIMETFDGVLELMTKNSVVYGGAVRDCLANMPLLGDLDIAISQQEFDELSHALQISSKWIPKEPEPLTARRAWKKPTWSSSGRLLASKSSFAKVGYWKTTPMSGVSVFVDQSGKEVQLITSSQTTKDIFQDTLYMARVADILCCGVVMTADGRVFEVLRGAEKDCRDHVLRINRDTSTPYIDNLSERIEKLVDRGWTNKIDVRVVKDIKRKEAIELRRKERQLLAKNKAMAAAAMPGSSKAMLTQVIIGKPGDPIPDRSGPTMEYSAKDFARDLGSDARLLMHRVSAAARFCNLNVKATFFADGSVHFTTVCGHRLASFRTQLMHRIIATMKEGKS